MSIISGLYNPASPYYSAFNSVRSISRGDYDHHDYQSSNSSHDSHSSNCSSKMKELNALRVASNKGNGSLTMGSQSSTDEPVTKPSESIPVTHTTDEFRLSNGCNAELMTEGSLRNQKRRIEIELTNLRRYRLTNGLMYEFYDCSEKVSELESDLMKIDTCLDKLKWTRISESFI